MEITSSEMFAFLDSYNEQAICYSQSPDHPCGNCSKTPDEYRIHQYRDRQIRFKDMMGLVHVAIVVLIRWKCTLCSKTFTEYPPFVLPYKRYIVTDMICLCKTYVENDSMGYKKTVSHEGRPISYARDPFCDLSPSTVWRWLAFFGSLKSLVTICISLLNNMYGIEPKKKIFHIYPLKYRSEERLKVLENACLYFYIDQFWISQTHNRMCNLT